MTRPDGGPAYGFGQRITVCPTLDAAKALATALDPRGRRQDGPLSAAPVELKVLPTEAQRTQRADL